MNQSKPINYFFYFLVILILLCGSIYYFNNKKSGNPDYVENKLKELENSEIKLKEYKSDLHKITISYPENWQTLDLGGNKNVTEPLKAENIILFFDPKEDADPTTDPSASASVKIKRYVIEKDRQITSQDDWFNYIKGKIDATKESDTAKAAGYQLVSVANHDKVNNLWAVEENYTEADEMKARDIYLFHDGDLYQLICKSKQVVFNNYEPYFNSIIDSIRIN